MSKFAILAGAALVATGVLSCSAPAEDPPLDHRPRRWTPAALSTAEYEATPTFTPDGKLMVFLKADPSFSTYKLLQSRCVAGRWTKAETPSFTTPLPAIEADPFITADGKRLYYISSRHSPQDQDFDIWQVDLGADGTWGTPQRLPEPVNSKGAELLPRMDAAGRLYFGSDRAGGYGGGDIYVASQGQSGRWQVENVGPPVSSAAYEYEAEISRDGKTMVVVADRGDRSHLYRYHLGPGGWAEIGRVPANDGVFQVGPLLSPKADRLLFAQKEGDRSGEIFLSDLTTRPDPSWPPECS